MGWGRTLFLGDIGNRLDIEDTERDIASLRSRLGNQAGKDRAQDVRIVQLELENRELELYLAALVRLLVRKGAVTQGEVEALVQGIDGRSEDPGEA